MTDLYRRLMASKEQKDRIDSAVVDAVSGGRARFRDIMLDVKPRLVGQLPKGTNWDRVLDAALRRVKKAGKIRLTPDRRFWIATGDTNE